MGKCDVIKHLCAFRRLSLTNDMKFTQNIHTSSLPIAMMSLVHDLSPREGSLLGYRWHNVQPKRKKVPLVAHFLLLSPITVMKQTGLSLAACLTLLLVTIQRSTADVKAPRSVTTRVGSTNPNWKLQTGNRKAWPCQLFNLVMCSIGWMQLYDCLCMHL